MTFARCALATAALMSLVLAAAAAQYCEDYTAYLRHLANSDTGGGARDVVVSGNLAYVADRQSGLRIYDITEPALPEFIGGLATVGAANNVVTDGVTAWVTSIQGTLYAVDVTNSSEPQILGTLELPDTPRDLTLWKGYLLVAASSATLRVVDITDPAGLKFAGALDLPGGFARGVAAHGSVACIAHDLDGLRVIDLADPAAPTLLATVPMNSATMAVGLSSDGSIAHVANDAGDLTLVSLADPVQPVVISSVPLPVAFNRDVFIDGSLTWLAGRTLRCIVTSDPYNPRPLGEVTALAATYAVHVADGAAFVAAGPAGLEVFDATNPAPPPPLSIVPTEQPALGVAVDQDYTYLTAGDLFIYDHPDPTAPILRGSALIPNTASRVVVANDHAYVTSTTFGADNLHVIDVSDPDDPVPVASLELPGHLGDILVGETALYVADFLFGGVFVVDITDPAHPVHRQTLETPSLAVSLALADERFYVTTGVTGGAAMTVFDVADPFAPTFLADFDLIADAAWGLAASGTTVYVTIRIIQGPTSLRIYDLADLNAPQILGSVELPDVLHTIVLAGPYAHIVAEHGQILAVDVSDPAAPFRLGATPLPDNAYDIVLGDETVHAAVTDAGMMILPQHCEESVGIEEQPDEQVPEAVAVLAAYPNPFNPQITVSFSLQRTETITLDVFDLAGRRVARLARGEFTAGRHALVWRGRDEAGRELSSGTYFARLASEARIRTVKLTLVR